MTDPVLLLVELVGDLRYGRRSVEDPAVHDLIGDLYADAVELLADAIGCPGDLDPMNARCRDAMLAHLDLQVGLDRESLDLRRGVSRRLAGQSFVTSRRVELVVTKCNVAAVKGRRSRSRVTPRQWRP